MTAQSVLEDLRSAGSLNPSNRALIITGDGVPSDTANVGIVYINTASGAAGNARIYVWDAVGTTWDELSAGA